MSLIKQLWIGILSLLLLALGGNFVISTLTAKTYLQEQLRLKNIDNANSLALSISQMPDKDPVTLELLISAQFDSGHYEYIIFQNTDKQAVVARRYDNDNDNQTQQPTEKVPAWFAKRVNFDAAPGIAQIQDGWQQAGTLVVKSHSGYALEALWKNTRDLLEWFLFATLLSGLIGSIVLKYISRPLDVVVSQAEAIGERRFIVSEEPKTKEFQRLVRAMNRLSNSVKQMLEKEARQLELLRRESQTDPLTGIANRTHFLHLFDAQLTNEDAQDRGVLVIARLMNLQQLNNQLGHHQVDQLLCAIASVFRDINQRYPGSHAGRLNGSDFCLLIPTDIAIDIVGAEISQQLNFQLIATGYTQIGLPMALSYFQQGDLRTDLLHTLDGALAEAEVKGNRAVIIRPEGHPHSTPRNLGQWRDSIEYALTHQHIALVKFPVRNQQGELIHDETAVRLQLDEEQKTAGYFIPWAVRLGIMSNIDLAVLRLALNQLSITATQLPQPMAINVSSAALCSASFREQALELIAQHPAVARFLWLEFSESCVLRHPEELRIFITQLRKFGCLIGLEHVGLEFTRFDQLQEMGLAFLKIDSAIIRDINTTNSNQAFVQSLCLLGHSIGLTMIAEGVQTAAEQQTLFGLGIDAVTGPFVQ
ncbi:bifunctional diguanylate cyclase/phosphodiesterase [Cellvibrio fontiphilus]|uniref:EAL domain-containing protein n=1 Tax=Cellvibrio fontiphilus TaxID=1815559 RepID=A0ABV7FG48_9GAMM